MPDGRKAGVALSEGISPVQGADRHGPTAVVKSAAKMDHLKTGGTLLNMKVTPALLQDETGIDRLAQLVRSYFKLDGHHVQFNVVTAETLRQAQARPEEHRDLIVPRGRLQRLLLRLVAGITGRNHRPHGTCGNVAWLSEPCRVSSGPEQHRTAQESHATETRRTKERTSWPN